MKSYHFSAGNSSRGPIGFCASVKARTQKEALEILREQLPYERALPFDDERVEYIEVYITPENLKTRHIDEVDEIAAGGDD